MSATASTIPTRPGPALLRQTVVIIGGSAGIGLETARRAIGYGVPSDFELNFGWYLPALGRVDDDDTDTRPNWSSPCAWLWAPQSGRDKYFDKMGNPL